MDGIYSYRGMEDWPQKEEEVWKISKNVMRGIAISLKNQNYMMKLHPALVPIERKIPGESNASGSG